MHPLIKVLFIIVACFGATFLVIKSTGILTLEQIKAWLMFTEQMSPIYVAGLVALLLFLDLFIAMPTLSITVLAGYFLGHFYGVSAAMTGFLLAGVSGYVISRYYGERILRFLIKDDVRRDQTVESFHKHGFMMIVLSRAVPILPEATACLSGITRMPFRQFLLAWLISSVPYALVASYAGSISSIDNPEPAIITAIGMSLFLWLAWFFYHRTVTANRV
ncbi:MAG: TVP38/TMEM64 family protein [Arenicella sp.]